MFRREAKQAEHVRASEVSEITVSAKGSSDYRERGDARRTKTGERSLVRQEPYGRTRAAATPGSQVNRYARHLIRSRGVFPFHENACKVRSKSQAGSGVMGFRVGDALAEVGESNIDGRA